MVKLFILVFTQVDVSDGWTENSVWDPMLLKSNKESLKIIKKNINDVVELSFFNEMNKSQIWDFKQKLSLCKTEYDLESIINEYIDDEIIIFKFELYKHDI